MNKTVFKILYFVQIEEKQKYKNEKVVKKPENNKNENMTAFNSTLHFQLMCLLTLFHKIQILFDAL